GGKYVNPVHIEQKLIAGCNLLIGALIIAEGRRFVSCLLFVDFDALPSYQKKYGAGKMSADDFLKSAVLNSRIESLIEKVNHDLDRSEQIKKYHLVTDRISIDGSEITPSMKLRRS